MRAPLDLELIEQIMVAYLINLPIQELEQQRLIFHLKAGYFHYLNKHRLKDHSNTKLKKQEELAFMQKINEYLPIDNRMFPYQVEQYYKLSSQIPCFGAIVPHQTQQGCFYLFIRDRRTGKYGFPKGKRTQGETEIQCAQRETKQQTGFIIKCHNQYIQPFHQSIEPHSSRRYYRFYHGSLQNGQKFVRRIRCEEQHYCDQISEIVWLRKEQMRHKRFNAPTSETLKVMKLLE